MTWYVNSCQARSSPLAIEIDPKVDPPPKKLNYRPVETDSRQPLPPSYNVDMHRAKCYALDFFGGRVVRRCGLGKIGVPGTSRSFLRRLYSLAGGSWQWLAVAGNGLQ